MIVEAPAETPVATPIELMVPTLGSEEVQVTEVVRLAVVPLEYVPVAVNGCVVPAAIDGFAGVTAIEVSCVVEPVPRRLAVCGLLLAPSTTVKVPVVLPVTVGVKVTLITQLPAAGMDAGHDVAAKGPVVVTLLTANAVGS